MNLNLDYADWMDYADDFSDVAIPAKAGITILSFLLLGVLGCTKQPAPIHLADSATTAKIVHQMEGKHGRLFRGPADILGDTTKNARRPPMVKDE